MNDREYNVYKAFGGLMVLAASVAADFPDDFAQTVGTWNREQITAIIEALEKERRKTE